ncbi:MAG: FHA domain-containing protein [Deltaproteobacteria bacterium]|nr:FHA domain-containing protein [Deltaproteobacteria bacterium]
MFHLKIIDPNGKTQKVQLDEEPITLGRGNDCDLVLGSRSVSRHHLRAWREGNSVFIEDLTEGQGTLLDGQAVEEDVMELEPGCQIEIGVYTLSLIGTDASDTSVGTRQDLPAATDKHIMPKPQQEQKKGPRLVGLRGSLKGKEFVLETGETEVGRGESNHITLDYKSISRLHAKLTTSGDRCKVQDMRSSNGTFLNKKRTESGRLRHGDSLRFGAIEFVFAIGQFDLNKHLARKKRKLMILSMVATLAAISAVVVVFLGLLEPPKPKPATPQIQQPTTPTMPIELQAEKHLKQAQSLVDQLNWEGAKKEVAESLSVHPLCKPCRGLAARIEAELINAKQFKKGMVEYDLKHWAEARVLLKSIPDNSTYFKQASGPLDEAKDKLSRYYKLSFKDANKKKDYAKAHGIAKEYMRLNPCDKPVYEAWVKKFEKQLRRRRRVFTPYLYDCESVKHRGPMEPRELIRKIYPEKAIADAIMDYYDGKIDKALATLSKLGESRNHSVKAQARDLFSKMKRLKTKQVEGGVALMRGNDEGRKTLIEALKLDAKIIPASLTSKYRSDIAMQLASRLYKQGFVIFSKKDYFKAFAFWDECLRLHPNDRNCEGGMKKLERVALNVLKKAEATSAGGDNKHALAILKDMQRIVRPGTIPYKQAQHLIDKLSQ